MGRRDIFEVVKDNYNFDDEFERIYRYCKNSIIYNDSNGNSFTIEKYADTYNIQNWKNRKGFSNCDECCSLLGLNKDLSDFTYEDKLLWLEYILNIIKIIITNNKNDLDKILGTIIKDIRYLLDTFGYEYKNFEDEQQVIIVLKNAYATSVVKLVDDNLAGQVLEYNHFNMKGNMEAKRNIIFNIYREYEGFEKELEKTNKNLCSDLGFMVNKFHIRHNNEKDIEQDKFCEKFFELTIDEQEEWYDKTYDLLLLAFLTRDGNKIRKELKEFKEISKTL